MFFARGANVFLKRGKCSFFSSEALQSGANVFRIKGKCSSQEGQMFF
jgi:hypothetical protein